MYLQAAELRGQWLQPRLDGRTQAPATTHPAPTTPAPTSPAPTSPTLAIDRPAGPSHISRVVATSSPVDAITVTRQAVWLAVGGLVLRVHPATGRALVVPEVEDSAAPVVDLTAGAGAVWAVTTSAGLLRIDPHTARLTTPNPGPVSAIAAGASGVWAVCCQGRGPCGRVTRLDPASGRVIATVRLPARPLAVGPARTSCGSVAPRAGCGGSTRRTAGRPAHPAASRPGRRRAGWRAGGGWCGGLDQRPGAWGGPAGRPGTRDRRPLGGRWVRPGGDARWDGLGDQRHPAPGPGRPPGAWPSPKPARELHTDQITAMAAAEDGGLWLGTAQGLFHVDQRVLRQG